MMDDQELEKLKYPIGKFQVPAVIDEKQLKEWIDVIADFPNRLQAAVSSLSESELAKQYRPQGWTIKQLVHHCADSHMNSFIRFKLALTEEQPVIKPYAENLWAELADTKTLAIDSSLVLLHALHARWVYLLKNMSNNDFERTFVHPETKAEVTLKVNLGIYAWHCNHHFEHILLAKRI